MACWLRVHEVPASASTVGTISASTVGTTGAIVASVAPAAGGSTTASGSITGAGSVATIIRRAPSDRVRHRDGGKVAYEPTREAVCR